MIGSVIQSEALAEPMSRALLNLDAALVELVALAEAARAQNEQFQCGVGGLLDEGLVALSDQRIAEQIRASIRTATGTPLAGDPHLDYAAANCAYYQILAMIHQLDTRAVECGKFGVWAGTSERFRRRLASRGSGRVSSFPVVNERKSLR